MAVINSAVMNIEVHVSFDLYVEISYDPVFPLLGIHPDKKKESKFLMGSMGPWVGKENPEEEKNHVSSLFLSKKHCRPMFKIFIGRNECRHRSL